jgi:hypothetical protein
MSERAQVARRAAAVLLAVAAVVYNDWLLQFIVPTKLSQSDSYVSEAFAADQPYRVLFSREELACSVITIAGALCACRLSRQRLAVGGWAAVAGFGLCSVADALMPMRCAPSVDRGCTESLPHTMTSGLVHFALFASMALFIAASRQDGAGLRLVRRWGPWLLPVSMAAAISSVGPFFGYPDGQGIAQRIHLVTAGLWLAMLAVEVSRTSPASAVAGAPADSGRAVSPGKDVGRGRRRSGSRDLAGQHGEA